jgi:hypothetical protein
MAKIFKVLDNVSVDGPGSSFNLNGVSSDFTLQVSATGVDETTDGFVFLEGSMDGTIWGSGAGWYYLGTGVILSELASLGLSNPPAANAGSKQGDSPHLAYRYVRARVHNLVGGPNLKVTAYLTVTNIEPIAFI